MLIFHNTLIISKCCTYLLNSPYRFNRLAPLGGISSRVCHTQITRTYLRLGEKQQDLFIEVGVPERLVVISDSITQQSWNGTEKLKSLETIQYQQEVRDQNHIQNS